MRLLLDTHTLLWALGAPEELDGVAREAIADGGNEVRVSAASVWEVAIKQAVGKLRAPDDLLAAIAEAGFEPLPITLRHADIAGRLPLHHHDPFDRMLVAQSGDEGLTVVTRDERFAAYGVPVLRA